LKRISKISILVFVVFIIVFSVIQLTSNKEDSIKHDLIENSKVYSRLIIDIKSTNFNGKYDKFIRVNGLPKRIQTTISKLEHGDEIQYLVISNDSVLNYYRIEIVLRDNWHVEYADEPNDFPKSDTYLKDNFIETWGVTKNWMIWHDDDFI